MYHRYGPPPISLPRTAIERGISRQVSLELHPPRLKVLRMTRDETVSSSSPPSHPYVTVSSEDNLTTLCNRLAAALTDESILLLKFRVWKVEPNSTDFDLPEFPLSRMASCSPTLISPSSTETVDQAGIQAMDAFVVEFADGDNWLYAEDKPLFPSSEGFFNRMTRTSSTSSFGGLFNNITSKSTYSSLTNGRTSYSTNSNKSLVPGTLGLGNMGNTCFMNSALQCLAHNQELTDYFLTGVFQEELNPDNPLGMQGAIAQAYGALVDRIWATSGPSSSYSPREFKSALQRFAPQFHGYQQHDSQELVAFLLDGLHEDLNRVLKKPYVEKPEWEGGEDLELVQLANKSWEGYMMRNDSVIVDLFQGQYQSTLVCPECQKISITFDPFMYLTLPLPVVKKWRHEIYYIPWDPKQQHVLVPVEIGRDASFKDLRALLGRWMGANPDNLFTVELFSDKFYKNLDDHVSCGDMNEGDRIVCYELPCNARQSRNYQKQPDDPFIIPIYLCDAKESSLYSRSQVRSFHSSFDRHSNFGYPYLVVIPQDQARTQEDIYTAVVHSLARWTDHSKDLYHLETRAPNGSAAVAEINENGDVITVEEADIAEEAIVAEEEADDMEEVISIGALSSKLQVKTELFNMKLRTDVEIGSHFSSSGRADDWQARIASAKGESPLLKDSDVIYLEFDEHMKAYYFGEEKQFEHARWTRWQTYTHPEYEAAQKANAQKSSKGISLQDCLEEFTKEEQLGEDDLWYCPSCKKHQQATKRFDLWKSPDILVVHLKRFSNSRTLRDKIDAFVDFPVEGLDLTQMVGERKALKRLVEKGLMENRDDLDEPLIYDLFAVDEHLGGLGGGHYRAYALNHLDQKWYHFDDSYVTDTQASQAVNANAYLLFYRRRSSAPLGGKSHLKIEEARTKPKASSSTSLPVDTQLPTPPNEPTPYGPKPRQIALPSDWRPNTQFGAGSLPSPEDELPSFESSSNTQLEASALELLQHSEYQFPTTASRFGTSPTSSNEADGEVSDQDIDDFPGLGSASPVVRSSGSESWSPAVRFDDEIEEIPSLQHEGTK